MMTKILIFQTQTNFWLHKESFPQMEQLKLKWLMLTYCEFSHISEAEGLEVHCHWKIQDQFSKGIERCHSQIALE